MSPIELGKDSPLLPTSKFDETAADRSRRGHARARAGAGFEEELKTVHELYRMRRRAKIHHLGVPSTGAGGRIRRTGTAPFDFMGSMSIAGEGGWAVAFDAKSHSAASYTHAPEQLHQLRELLDFIEVQARAFLLIRDRALRIAYLIDSDRVLRRLATGATLILRQPKARKGSIKLGVDDYVHAFPFVREPSELLISQSTPRWDWLGLLEELELGRRDEEITT